MKLTERAVEHMLKHPLITTAIVVVLFLSFVYGLVALLLSIEHKRQDRAITKIEKTADAQATKAADQVDRADQERVERKAEDLHRDRNLRPQLENAARDVAAARSRSNTARRNYEQARNTRDDRSSDVSDLHQRNCSDLRELLPGETFAYCNR